jgi:hypothetical protein
MMLGGEASRSKHKKGEGHAQTGQTPSHERGGQQSRAAGDRVSITRPKITLVLHRTLGVDTMSPEATMAAVD